MPVELQEEVLVERYSAFRLGVNLDHPTLYAIGVDLVVDGGIERVAAYSACGIGGTIPCPGLLPSDLGDRLCPGRNCCSKWRGDSPIARHSFRVLPCGMGVPLRKMSCISLDRKR